MARSGTRISSRAWSLNKKVILEASEIAFSIIMINQLFPLFSLLILRGLLEIVMLFSVICRMHFVL